MRGLIQVTTWERVSLARRLICAFARVAVLIALVLAVANIGYAYRYPIEAKLWHWKHGYSTTMGNYEVPVPEHWLILDQDFVAFTLMNISPKRPQPDGKFHTTASIGIFPFRTYPAEARRMDFWRTIQRQGLVRDKVQPIEEKTLKFGDESITCIGGPYLNTILRDTPNHLETDAISLNCMSERGLDILFVGEPADLQPFYTFLTQIRRKG